MSVLCVPWFGSWTGLGEEPERRWPESLVVFGSWEEGRFLELPGAAAAATEVAAVTGWLRATP